MMVVTVSDRTRHAPATGSFADVYAAHRDDVVRLAFLLCGDRHLAEDLAAEAFARTWRQWERGRVDDVGPYVRRAVVNLRNSWWRRTSLHRNRVTDRASGDRRAEQPATDAVADRDQLAQALQRLSQRQRQVLVLRYFADLSVEDTAAELGISPGTVKSMGARGLERLREMMGEPA